MIAREALGLLIRERQDPGQPNADRGFSREFAGAMSRAACPDGSVGADPDRRSGHADCAKLDQTDISDGLNSAFCHRK
jgi:hypothetical protein